MKPASLSVNTLVQRDERKIQTLYIKRGRKEGRKFYDRNYDHFYAGPRPRSDKDGFDPASPPQWVTRTDPLFHSCYNHLNLSCHVAAASVTLTCPQRKLRCKLPGAETSLRTINEARRGNKIETVVFVFHQVSDGSQHY